MSRSFTRLVYVLAFLVLAASALTAQTAQITGRVVDTSGAVVSGVEVTATNVQTQTVRTTKSNAEGYYTVPALPLGVYRIALQYQGLRPIMQEGVTLAVNQVARLDFTMEVGLVTEKVEVSGEAPQVDTAGATLGEVVESRRIGDLPLNGRNALSLELLVPGVRSEAGPTGSGAFADRGVALTLISINGGVTGVNNFMLDGLTNNNVTTPDLNVNPAVDAVEEFKVQTNTMSAEYGLTSGGIISIVTKSGTNQLHGALYEFVRNDKFDARNAFALTRAPYRYNQFGGAAGGPIYVPKVYDGRNKSFFFFNYEEWRYQQGQNPILTVPTLGQRSGNFSDLKSSSGVLIPIFDPATTRANPSGSGYIRDPFPNNVAPVSRLDPVSQNVLALMIPLPNLTPINPFTNQNNFISSYENSLSMRQYSVKIDQRLSAKNSLFFRFTSFRHFTNAGVFGVTYPNPVTRERLDTMHPKNILLSDTHVVSPRMINEFRVGVSRLYFTFVSEALGQNWPGKLGLPASVPPYILPVMSISGLATLGGASVGVRGDVDWQFSDMVTMSRASHTVKAGVDARLRQGNNFIQSIPSGSFSFPSTLTDNPQQTAGTGSGVATFLLGAVGSASLETYLGYSDVGYAYSFFVQDDWKITPRLTLNLGLRYDYQSPPVERNHGNSNFNPYGVNPQNGLLGRMEYASIDYAGSPWLSNRDQFSPRFGFAYDLLGNKKTVLRGGYGIFRQSIFYFDFWGSNAGFATTTTSYLPPAGNSNLPAFQFKDGFPYPPTAPLGSKLGPGALLSAGVTYDQTTDKYPMNQQWNLSLQQQLPGGWLISAAYSGNHGTHLIAGSYDFNQLGDNYLNLGLALQNQVPNQYAGLVPGTLGAATLTQSQALKPYPYYTGITVGSPSMGDSIYHALLLTAEKRLAKGFVLLASYTGAKLIDDSVTSPESFGAAEQVSVTGYQDGKFNRRLERSLDPTDVSQRFVLSCVYEFPFGKGKRWSSSSGAVNKVIGGWQINTVTTVQDGLPLVVTGASNFLASRPNSTGVSAHLDNRSAQGWFNTTVFVNPPNYTYGTVGRVLPDVRNPGVTEVDFSLIKDTSLRERLRLQFRAEAFNILNIVNLGYPNATFVAGANGGNASGTFGVISSARDPRLVQLGLKLIF